MGCLFDFVALGVGTFFFARGCSLECGHLFKEILHLSLFLVSFT